MMRRIILALAIAAMVLAPMANAAPDSKTITITANWTGGVTLTLSRLTANFDLPYPHNSAWIGATGGPIQFTVDYSVNVGRHVRLLFTSGAWSPAATGLTPENTLRLNFVTPSVPPFIPLGAYPAPAVGAETVIWTSLSNPMGSGSGEFLVECKNINLASGTFTGSLTVVFADVE